MQPSVIRHTYKHANHLTKVFHHLWSCRFLLLSYLMYLQWGFGLCHLVSEHTHGHTDPSSITVGNSGLGFHSDLAMQPPSLGDRVSKAHDGLPIRLWYKQFSHTPPSTHSLRNSHTARVNNQGILTAITGLLDVGVVYLRDIRSDGFALFSVSLPGEGAWGGRTGLWHSFKDDFLLCLSDDGGLGSQCAHHGPCTETIAPLQALDVLHWHRGGWFAQS